MSSKWLSIVLFMAFAIRAVAIFQMGDREPGPDALDDYLPMAANVIAGRGFINAAGEPDSVRGPAYALFIAAAQTASLNTGIKPILWAQALLDILTAVAVAAIAKRTIDSGAGLIACSLYALNPVAIYSCTLVGPEILFAFLLTITLAAYTLGIETIQTTSRQYRWWMLCSGLAMGVTVLSRATPMLLVPFLGLWIFVRQFLEQRNSDLIVDFGAEDPFTDRFRRGLIGGLIFTALAASTVLPWTYRNWTVFHEFIPVVANGGVNFYAGSSERFWQTPDEHHRQRALRRDELIALQEIPVGDQPVSPAAGDKYQYQLGMANYRLAWKQDPKALLSYLFRKSLRIWYATQSGKMERFVGSVNFTWLALATVGLFAACRMQKVLQVIPCVMTIAYFPLVLTAMYPLARYAVGFTPCLCVLAAASALWIRPKAVGLVADQNIWSAQNFSIVTGTLAEQRPAKVAN